MKKMAEQHWRDLRGKLKTALSQCTTSEVYVFRRMYSPGNLDSSLSDVVDSIPEGSLDWAWKQVRKTIDRSSSNDPDGSSAYKKLLDKVRENPRALLDMFNSLLFKISALAGEPCQRLVNHGELCLGEGMQLQKVSAESLCWVCRVRKILDEAVTEVVGSSDSKGE